MKGRTRLKMSQMSNCENCAKKAPPKSDLSIHHLLPVAGPTVYLRVLDEVDSEVLWSQVPQSVRHQVYKLVSVTKQGDDYDSAEYGKGTKLSDTNI